MSQAFYEHLEGQLQQIRDAGLFKGERVLTTSQQAQVKVAGDQAGREVLNLCANNYLGLAGHWQVRVAASQALEDFGFGLASVRFICGTQTLHKQLESRVSQWLGTEDCILYSSCFDANGGLFETILGAEDAVISDQLNHASIIDGVRLCKAKRYRYVNGDMADLARQLEAAKAAGARFLLIATDGVFSMDGSIAPLADVCELADRFGALVMVDDSHATGFVGPGGRGTPAYHGVADRIDVLTGTFGKALGGAAGGFTTGRQPIVDLLRQRSRPYLFSNTLAPVVAAGSLAAIELIDGPEGASLRERLEENTRFFRAAMTEHGFEILPGTHPIVPVMLHDAVRAGRFAEAMLRRGVYVIAFSYPVVPQGAARIRTQISAAHSLEDLRFAVEQFVAVREELG